MRSPSHLLKSAAIVFFGAAALATLAGCGRGSQGQSLLVLSASSAQDAIRDAASQVATPIDVAAGGSNSLVRQLSGGAQADVLITADAATMRSAVDAGLTASEPVTVARSRLVLAVPAAAESSNEIRRLSDVDFTDKTLVVCSQPVPCGAATQAALSSAGITPVVSSFEPNSRQTLGKVALGVADAAFVWDVDLRSDSRVEAAYSGADLPKTHYQAAILTGSSQPDQARAFIDRLTSSEGQRLLAGHGFLPAQVVGDSS